MAHPTAQDPDELFDIVNEDGSPTGITKRRADVHRDGDWHRAIHIWVWGVDDDGPYILMNQRGRHKDTWPLALDATVGGHLGAGETVEDAYREVEEEIGVPVDPARLHYLYTRARESNGHIPGIIDRERQEIFLLRDDRPLTDFRPQVAELEGIAALCERHELVAVTDEIYEHILYEGEHVPLATLPGMRARTVTISGASKTFSVTGWRIGTIIAPADITDAIRKVHDFLTVGAPAPLQEACATALETLGRDYYEGLARDYRERRDVLLPALQRAGFRCTAPQGAYYILADFSALSARDDTSYAHWLARGGAEGRNGVAAVPGSSFFHRPADGSTLVRFAFCKRIETLRAAAERLQQIACEG